MMSRLLVFLGLCCICSEARVFWSRIEVPSLAETSNLGNLGDNKLVSPTESSNTTMPLLAPLRLRTKALLTRTNVSVRSLSRSLTNVTKSSVLRAANVTKTSVHRRLGHVVKLTKASVHRATDATKASVCTICRIANATACGLATCLASHLRPPSIIEVQGALFEPPRGDSSGVRVLKPGLQRALFVVSSLDAIMAVIEDPGRPDKSASTPRIAMPRLFGLRFFAPRVLYTIGAMARGLQLSTGLTRVFDPGMGVTGLVNVGAAWANAKWLPKVSVTTARQ